MTSKNKTTEPDLLDDLQEIKPIPVQMITTIRKIEETRGRKPLGPDILRSRIRDELTRIFLKIEKEAYKNYPNSNDEVQVHVIRAIRRVID